MASSHRTDRVSARRNLSDNPGLVFITPCSPPPGAGEHFQPPDGLRDSNMFSVHSKPNGQNRTADSQITTSSASRSRNTGYDESRQRSSELGTHDAAKNKNAAFPGRAAFCL